MLGRLVPKSAEPLVPSARSPGFTLIELLVVLTIIALIVGIAPAAMQRVLPGLELRAAAREVASGLREARGLAIRRSEETTVAFDVVERRFEVEGLGEVKELGEDIELRLFTARSELVDEDVGRIRFFSDGTSTGGRVTLVAGEAGYAVDVDWLTGRVHVGRP
jgi:general secretion pathway protein H